MVRVSYKPAEGAYVARPRADVDPHMYAYALRKSKQINNALALSGGTARRSKRALAAGDRTLDTRARSAER